MPSPHLSQSPEAVKDKNVDNFLPSSATTRVKTWQLLHESELTFPDNLLPNLSFENMEKPTFSDTLRKQEQ